MTDEEVAGVLTEKALEFLSELHQRFAARRDALLADRARRVGATAGGTLGFLEETEEIRASDWRVAQAPRDLIDRRVEITGPTERKMAINALNSGARVWLADLEDANTPHWENVIGGQVNLRDAVRATIAFTSPEGKAYALRNDVRRPTIVVRPRGWHLDERHLAFAGRTAIGALVDFGLYFVHNAAELVARGTGPYFYLPKLESHLEARLWNDVFLFAQERLGIARGTIRATVLIETISAAFEMDEILFELREHVSGLNAGRWDYLFSLIKKFGASGKAYVLPDRNSVTMTAPFMRAYTELLVQTCHKRGAFAIGGMAAFIPNRRDPAVNAVALAKVREDKEREAADGFDGSWVAHPDLVPLCTEVFDAVLGDRPNQLDRLRPEVRTTARDLLALADTPGAVTTTGLRNNLDVALRYTSAWLDGTGAVAIHNLMEDAATAEIARAQVWQWMRNAVTLEDGTAVTAELVDGLIDQQAVLVGNEIGGRVGEAAVLLRQLILADEFTPFLTLPAYELVP